MKVTIIGYWGAYPGVNEATSGYLFQSGDFSLLVDCGSGVLSQLQKYITIEDLDAVLLSHYHHDHVADIGPLQYARLVNRMLQKVEMPLPIYGHTLDKENFEKLTKKPDVLGIPYNPNEINEIGPFSISFIQTNHPAICYAMKITDGRRTVVYTADTSFMEELVPFAKAADVLLCESSFYRNQDGKKAGHLTSAEAGKLAEQSKVKKLVLTHLPHYGDHQQLLKEAQQESSSEIILAKSGLII